MNAYTKREEKPFLGSKCSVEKEREKELPGGPVVRTLHFHCRGPGFDPRSGPGTKIPYAVQHGQKKDRYTMIASAFWQKTQCHVLRS